MIINVVDIIEHVDRDISRHYGQNYADNIIVVIPILCHEKSYDDMVILSSSKDKTLSPNMSNGILYFTYDIGDRHYRIYENWYDYKGRTNNFEDIYQYMSQYNKLMYEVDMSFISIYYRFKHGFPMDSDI